MAELHEVKAPDVGGEVEVIEILVSPGDEVAVEQSLLTVESDKATMDIPAPIAGVVAELKVTVGDKIKEGDLLRCLTPRQRHRQPHLSRLRSQQLSQQ